MRYIFCAISPQLCQVHPLHIIVLSPIIAERTARRGHTSPPKYNKHLLCMQIYTLEQDIPVLCERAHSFPEDIMGAFERLQTKYEAHRTMYGLSRPEEGKIVYMAAADRQNSDDTAAMGCEVFDIPKGRYAYVDITDWAANIPAIGKTFDELCHLPGIDPQGYCVEWYVNPKDVRCMVRLAD